MYYMIIAYMSNICTKRTALISDTTDFETHLRIEAFAGPTTSGRAIAQLGLIRYPTTIMVDTANDIHQ